MQRKVIPFLVGLTFVVQAVSAVAQDIVPASQSIADRKVYRQAFTELRRERLYYDYMTANTGVPVVYPSHTVWFGPMGRAGQVASVFSADRFNLESYGFQGGSTFFSTPDASVGLLLGYQRGLFRNGVSSNRFDDYNLGLYFSRFFDKTIECRGYIGGGHQRHNMHRFDGWDTYGSVYEGDSFELNLEVATYLDFWCGSRIRPYAAMDIEHVTQQAAQESGSGLWFLDYDRNTLSQLFFRVGFDIEKQWQRVDLIGGIGYTCMAIGKTAPSVAAFMPNFDYVDGMLPGTRFGRSSLNLRAGLNLHLNAARTNTLFIDYMADIFMDRRIGSALHTGSVGFSVRF